MRVERLAGLRAADLPPLVAELGAGLVALVGSPEDAGEVRRAIVWSAMVGDDGVTASGRGQGAALEALWGGTGGLDRALEAAVRWIAGRALARVETARAVVGEAPAPRASRAPPPGLEDGEDLRRLLENALGELRVRERELRELRAEWAEVTGDVEQATMDWLRERQDAETQLQTYRDRARELKARVAEIMAGGPDSPCPTCGRPLADHLKDVRVQMREEFESVVQDGSWWKRRREQLEGKPEHLRLLEGRGLRVSAAVESGAERVERARTRVRDLEAWRAGPAGDEVTSAEVRALDRLADELRGAALASVLREAGRLAERISAGRILWIRQTEAGPVAEGVFHGGVPAPRDRAAVDLACRLAAAVLARLAGAPLEGIVVGEALEGLDPEDRLRAGDLLAELSRSLGQVLVVTGTDLVDRMPEAFDQALEIRPAGAARGAGALRPLGVGAAALRMTS